MIHENKDMCQTAQKLDYQLKKKLEHCLVEGKGKRDECLKPTKPETVEEYLTIPWKSEYKKKMLKAIIAEMVNVCSSSQKKLEEIIDKISLPVFAVGGITPDRISSCMQAGAYGTAGISAVMNAEDISATVQKICEKAKPDRNNEE